MAVMPAVRVYVLAALLILVVCGGYAMQSLSGKESAAPLEGTVTLESEPVQGKVLARVYVSGAVAVPGLYQVETGMRVADVLALAGGADESADLQKVNLAQKCKDGMQVKVPARKTLSVKNQSSRAVTGEGAPAVFLNVASEAELDRLPGISPVLARRIVQYRVEHGSFHSLQELLQIPGVNETLLERLQGRLTL
nr:ComEA family DNA-binding protein [uncultured Anaeromusa sp.]